MKRHCLVIFFLLWSCKDYPNKETFYYNSGEIKAVTTVYNSEGKRKTDNYHKNGWLIFTNEFESYDGYGTTTKFDSLGNILEVNEISKSGRHGKSKEFYPNGKLKLESEYKNNQPDGIGREYYKSGDLLRKYVYNKGKLIYLKEYKKDSSLVGNILSIIVDPIIERSKNYSIGDTIDIQIRLEYSDYDKIGLMVGPLNGSKQLIPELSSRIYISDSMQFTYRYPLKTLGENTITGIIREYKYSEIIQDTLYQVEAGEFPFERSFRIE